MKQIITYVFIIIGCLGYTQDGERGSKPKVNDNATKGTKRALIIGISDYNRTSLKLNYADNDAALFKNYLQNIEGLEDNNISILINSDAVSANIIQELKKQYNSAESGDTLYLYFAGHGDVVDDFDEKEGFLLATDANDQQEYDSGGTSPLSLLNRIISKLTQKEVKVILILDACRSGFASEASAQNNMGTIQAMFKNSTKILSCGENELSHEGSDVNHGYFTYYLIKGLTKSADINNDKDITYRELGDYLYDNVNKIVLQNFNASQGPVIRTKNDRDIFKKVTGNETTINFEDIASTIDKTIALASRNIKTVDLKDKTYGEFVSKFNAAISRKSYSGKSSSAYEIYKSAKNNSTIPSGLLDKMQSSLVKILSNEANELINLYIEGSKNLPPSYEFTKQAKHLEICLELMGEDNFLYNRIKASQLLLESYAIIRSNNHPRYKLAKRKLKSALQLEPRAAYIHNALGLVYNNEKVYDSAFYHYNEAKKLINSWDSPKLNISDNFIDQYKFDDAKNYINSSLGSTGKNSLLKLGDIYRLQGKYHLAESYYQKAIDSSPNNSRALKKMAELQALKGNSKAASYWDDMAIKADSTKIVNIDLLGYIKANHISDENAEKLLLNAIDNNPESSITYCQYADFLSMRYKRLTRLRLADSLYNKAIKLNPYNTAAYNGKAWLQAKLRKPLKAIEVFKNSISTNVNNAEVYFNYGHYLNEKLKKYIEAEEQYRLAISKNKTYIKAYDVLVKLYNKQGKTEQSIALLNNTIIELPEVPEFWHLLGQTYFEEKNFTKAITAYEKASAIDTTFVKGNKNLGYSQVETNQFKNAEANLLSASRSDISYDTSKEISEYLINTAKDKQKFGTPVEAQRLYKMAFNINQSAETALIYANFLYINSQPEEAVNIALPSISKKNTKAINADLLRVLTKASIDLNNIDNTDYYYNLLIKIDKTTDYLLGAIYLRFKGNISQSEALRRKVDQTLFRSNKLKELYSADTIEKYIL